MTAPADPRQAHAAYRLLLDRSRDHGSITVNDLENALKLTEAAADPANQYLVVTADGDVFGVTGAESAVDLVLARPGVSRIVPLAHNLILPAHGVVRIVPLGCAT